MGRHGCRVFVGRHLSGMLAQGPPPVNGYQPVSSPDGGWRHRRTADIKESTILPIPEWTDLMFPYRKSGRAGRTPTEGEEGAWTG